MLSPETRRINNFFVGNLSPLSGGGLNDGPHSPYGVAAAPRAEKAKVKRQILGDREADGVAGSGDPLEQFRFRKGKQFRISDLISRLSSGANAESQHSSNTPLPTVQRSASSRSL